MTDLENIGKQILKFSSELPDGVKLVAVSKFHPVEALRAAYDARLIDLSMLSAKEIAQVNEYHAMVRERLTPYLNAEEAAWLADKTKAL